MTRSRLLFSVLLSGISLLAGCRQKPAASASDAAVPVETRLVEERDLPVEIPAVGTVEPVASVQLKAKVGGEVEKVGFADGAFVRKGQILFEIDPSPYKAALDRAEADLAIAKAQSKNSADQLQRYTTLSTKGAASQEQYAQFASTALQQEAEVAARQADVDAARLSLEWARVRSPLDGRAGAALAKAGNIVQAEGEILAVINQLEPIYVAFSLPESQLSPVRERLAREPIAVQARSPSTGRLVETGSLAFIDNNVDPLSGMVAMKAEFANSGETLWPGQFVDVLVELGEEKGAIVLPSAAILESQDGPRVFVIRDGRAKLRDVKIGRTYRNDTVAASGLSAGEEVVVNGQIRLKDGSAVSTGQPKAPAPGASVQ